MQKVRIHISKIILPTYKLGGEDLEPPLIREFTPRNDPVYPYTTQEQLSQETEMRQYEAVVLENDYLKLTFLPELNGRLYSAYDKINNAEMFYANPVIKPGLFALRGAWPAVGVEFNFPNSHTTTTLERVLCKTCTYEDGSASVIVGDIENTCRMAWSVEIKLAPDSARIKMESKLYNPTNLPQRYYYWINAACPVYPDTQFIYPPSTRRLYTHPPMDASRLGYLAYPVHDGTDISRFKNIKQHFPVFAENMQEDFYGIYHHNKNHGVVHIADHNLVRGRKLWMFGNARDGKIFIDLLSDEAKDYCELQTGPFTLQSDYRMLSPGTKYTQTDYWLPVADIEGFNVAAKEFAANVKVTGGKAKIQLYPAESLDDINIYVKENDQLVHSEKLSFAIGEKVHLELPFKNNEAQIIFADSQGQTIALYGVEAEKLKTDIIEHVSGNRYLKGKYLEEQGFRDSASRTYAAAADSDIQSKTAEARLALDCGKNSLALSILENVLSIDRNNPEALLYYGCLKRQNKACPEAEKAFSKAADTVLRMNALYEIAKCAVLQGNYRRALNVLDEVLSNGGEAQHLALYGLCLRKTGKQDKKILKRAEHSFCFAPLVLGEMLLRGQCDIELRHNPQIVIEIVCSYIELGLIADANYILNYFEINLPIALYYSAWLNKQLGDYEKAKSQLKTASAIGWRSHFAFRNESGTVLNYALHENPADSNARYHLACLLAYKNHMEKALKLWDEVQGENRTIALRNCGLCYWKALGDKRTAVQYYKHALQNNDVGAKTLIECAALFEECGMNNEITEIFSGRSRMVENDSRLKLALIKAHLLNNKPELAAGLLANGNFSLCEGKMLSRHLYEQTCNALAEQALKNKDFRKAAKFFLKAVEYPENIGIGKPSNNKEAQWFFKAGMVYKQAGYFSEADKCFGHGAERGEFLDINFIPLKNIIWEAQWDKIDIPYWENIIYRMHCLRCLDKNCQAKELSDKINRYLAFLDSSGRKSSAEYIKLSTLTNLRIKI